MSSKTSRESNTNVQHVDLLIANDQENSAAIVIPTPGAELSFPDGGYKAWLTVLGGWLSFIATLGFLSSFSVFESYYSTTVLPTYNPSNISWIGSLQIWGCFSIGLWSGRLSDTYGPKLPLALGTFFMVFGTMMASISTKYYHFILSQGLCTGIGFGLAFTPALAVQSQWFLRKRGLTVGLVMSGQNVGGVIWPVVVNQLINYDGISLGWMLRIIGFIQMLLMVTATLLVYPRFPRNTIQEAIPVKVFFANKRTSLFTLSTFIVFLSIYVPYFYITSYGMQWGTSARSAFYYPTILNAAAFFGCHVLGVVADSGIGFFNSLTVITFCCAVTAFGWIGARSNVGIILWTIMYGFLSGAIQTLFSPCISQLAPTPALIGTWNGLCITVVSFAVLGTGPIAGKLLDNTQGTNYVPMQLFTGMGLVIASTLFLLTRFLVSRKAFI